MEKDLLTLLLKDDFQDFLFANELVDEREFVLKHKSLFGIPSGVIAQQLIGRRKAKTKLPTFHNTKRVVYPPNLNLEQCSSEAAAKFKAEIIQQHLKKNHLTGVDLTGGFGVDSFFLSKICSQFQYIEEEESVLELVRHNHSVLGAVNIQHDSTSAEEFIDTTKEKFDFVFIDPSRRVKQAKVFKLSDCEPNVSALLPKIFERSALILIKASPLLDLQQGIKELQFVKSIYVVSIDNECKEVLFVCEKGFNGEAAIHCVDLSAQEKLLHFTFTEERNSSVQYSEPLNYLYEPNASILKAGAFKFVAKQFGLFKLDVNTHLYTSRILVENFPGRVFKIECVNPKENDFKKFFPGGKANVATRNYPLSPDELKKKLKLKDGSELFLFGVTSGKKMLLVAKRI
jgi:16S rRNA G966 N2-methylase RsmD